MNKICLIIMILVSVLTVQAYEFKGQIVDESNKPVEFAGIVAFCNDSVAGGGISDAEGLFCIEMADRCDSIRVSFVGYKDKIVSPVPENLGTIVLTPSATVLKEVVVKAPLIRREADRIVINIASNPLSANKNAQELLKISPGVWATDDALSIYGQEGTAVYIDDRKVNMSGTQLMTYLKSIQSSSIATIEIIPKAGAEYNANSSGGVIRINLRRNRVDGMNGSAGLNITAGEFKQWLNPFVNLGLHSGKWTFNLNGSLNGTPSDRLKTHEISTNKALNQTMTGVSRHKQKTVQGNLMLGLFYEPTDRDRIGLQFDYNPDRTRRTSMSETVTESVSFHEETLGKYISDERFHNFNATINWSHSMDKKGSVLKVISNYNYQSSSVDENSEMSWLSQKTDSIYTSDDLNRYNIFVSELSMRKVFNDKWSINIGAKYTFNDVANKSFHHYLKNNEWTSNSDYDYNTSYNENIVAAFATANGSAGRWKFKAGLRAEYFKTDNVLKSDNSFDLFPNANVAFNITERGDYTVALGYYRNIRRPSFWSLNPVARQVSDYSYTVGNPNLTPSFSDALTLDFVLAGKYTLAFGYNKTDKPIRQMFTSNPDYPERKYLTWGNAGKDRTVFIHGDGFTRINKWWNLYASATYVITSQKLMASEPFDTFGYIQLVASTTFILPKGFNLSVNCFYNSKMQIGNITVYPILNLNPTLQKQFGDHWSVSIGVEDMLQRTSRIRTSSAGYDRLGQTKNHIVGKIGVTYNFNSGKGFRKQRIEKVLDNSRLSKE